jgi:hypothetical protein
MDALNNNNSDDEELDPSTPRAPRHSQSFVMFEKTLTDHSQDDDDDLMVGFTPRGQASKAPAFFKSVNEGDEEEDEDEGGDGGRKGKGKGGDWETSSKMSDGSTSRRASLTMPSPRTMERHRHNNTIFEMKVRPPPSLPL